MNTTIEIEVPAMPVVLIATAAQFLDELISNGLPEVYGVKVEYSRSRKTWTGKSLLNSFGMDESQEIDAIREWAVALGGHLELGDEYVSGHKVIRALDAVKAIDGGGSFTVSTFLHIGDATAHGDI